MSTPMDKWPPGMDIEINTNALEFALSHLILGAKDPDGVKVFLDRVGSICNVFLADGKND